MPTAKKSRPGDLLSEREQRLSAEGRYVDLCLLFRRKKTGEILLKVGGRWDRLKGEFSDEEPERCHVIDCKEAQVPVVRRFAVWLAKLIAGETRERILLVDELIVEGTELHLSEGVPPPEFDLEGAAYPLWMKVSSKQRRRAC